MAINQCARLIHKNVAFFPPQPTQQLYDNEGGEEDGVHFGPTVPGRGAALP